MGFLGKLLAGLFGGGRNVVAETAEVFRVNAERQAGRIADYDQAALAQFASEFQFERRGGFDRFMDGLNRLPRPFMVISLFALMGSAMWDPIWFGQRMVALSAVPEMLWVLILGVFGFYFGGRFQTKSQEFRRSLAQTASVVPQVIENIEALEELRSDSVGVADSGTDAELSLEATETSDNAAIRAWQSEAGQ